MNGQPTLGDRTFLKKGTQVRCPNYQCRADIGRLLQDIQFSNLSSLPGSLLVSLPKAGAHAAPRDYTCPSCKQPWFRFQVYTDEGWKGG